MTAIDLFLRPPCRSLKGEADLVVASIEQTPFEAQVFDLVVSNHVMEHLYDLPAAFRELRRIAKPEALFAFSMPTRTWLAFAQLAVFSSRTFLWLSSRGRRVETRSLLTPLGHGAYMHFSDAWRVFNPAQWEKTFQQNGFKLLDKVPLLFYTPSELLLPPSYRLACLGICSSMLYLLQAQ